MAMTAKEKKQMLGLLIALPLIGVVAFWMYWRAPKIEAMQTMQQQVDSLQKAVDSARRDLARGTVQQLRQRVAEYEGSLKLMRRLVPTDAEVANLIDDISNRAKLRNIHIVDLTPQGSQPGGRFQVVRYRFVVLGHYDQIGGFLSDIASLPRIMVPVQLSLDPADDREAASVGDTTGSLLKATFHLRTFVKSAAGADTADGGDGG